MSVWENFYGKTWKGNLVKYLDDSMERGKVYTICKGFAYFIANFEKYIYSGGNAKLAQIMVDYDVIKQPKIRLLQRKASSTALEVLGITPPKVEKSPRKILVTDFDIRKYFNSDLALLGQHDRTALIIAELLGKGFELIDRSMIEVYTKAEIPNAEKRMNVTETTVKFKKETENIFKQQLHEDDQVVIIEENVYGQNVFLNPQNFPASGKAAELLKERHIKAELIIVDNDTTWGLGDCERYAHRYNAEISRVGLAKSLEGSPEVMLNPETCGAFPVIMSDKNV